MDRMMVEDSGELNLGSDHNLIWCEEVRTGRLEEGMSDPCLKWKVDGKIEWEEYQQLVMDSFRVWEEHLEVLWMGKDRKCTQIWELWRHIVLWATEIGIGKKKLADKFKSLWSREIEAAIQHGKYPMET